VIISLEVEKKNFRKEDPDNADFIIYHAFFFKQRLDYGVRCCQGFWSYQRSRNWY